MTLPSQFSLEEENFYKDIQDLVKNGSQNEKELSLFLQRYMDLLSRADLDEESFIINFTKAGLIIEASAKVYGTKVDRLWLNLENVLESLKSKNQGLSKKKVNGDNIEDLDVEGGCDDEEGEGKRKLPNSKRRKKVGDALFSVDDFLEIDNVTGVLGKNMNENSSNKEKKLKLCEKVPNMFIKNKKRKKKVDVCLNKCVDDKDVIRLRDWVVSSDCLLVKEIYTPRPENLVDSSSETNRNENEEGEEEEENRMDDAEVVDMMDVEQMESNAGAEENNLNDEKNNNTEMAVELSQGLGKKQHENPLEVDLAEDLNISKESDVAKFPNVLDRLTGDCLVDVDEVFWNTSKFQDVIPSKKMRAGKTNKPPCQLCSDKQAHKKRSKRCVEDQKLGSLESYFTPHVQPTVPEPQFGILPDEDLYNVFKIEMKLIEQLRKVNSYKNLNEAYHPDEKPEEFKNFLGFDGFEHCLMKKSLELQEDEMTEEMLRLDHEEDNDHLVADAPPPPSDDIELPLPVTTDTLRASHILKESELRSPGGDDDDDDRFAQSESEYQKLVLEKLKDLYAAKTSFAKNRELGMKISEWNEMIADKIKISQKRGALNMNQLASKIMNAFPPPSKPDEFPSMAFQELVKRQSQRDVPRYFFACLQLTNEGNLDISKSEVQPLATDCMVIRQLRSKRANCDLDESTAKSPVKNMEAAITKKRNSTSRSPSNLESQNISKKKKIKQKIVRSHKRSKSFNSVNNSKRRRCSISSVDSFTSE